jgi:glycosyltransferase involved in cell wall biosynthesis
MFEGHRIAAIVPAFREERLIRRTLESLPAFVDMVVVIDDASDDATSERASAWGDARLTVLRHADNRGVGAAIATGYAHAFEALADIAVVVGGDAQMDPVDMVALLAAITRGNADYAKGNRLVWPEARARMPLTRWAGNHVFSALTRLVTGLDVGDSQCGYTALRRDAALQLPLDSLWPRYGYPNDLLGLLATHGFKIADVPVRPVYADEQSGIGVRHALFVVPWVLVRVAMRRLVTRPLPALLPARVQR